ncbi:MAG TPA: ComEC/Rec2 family competence protein [Candidatus Nanopelagicaceae bacterium]
MSLRQASLQQSAIQKFSGGVATVRLQVSTDPTLTKAKVYGSTLAPSSYSFLATALMIGQTTGEYELRVPIRVITQSPKVTNLLPGQIFTAVGAVRKSKEARVAALFLVRGNIHVDTQASRWARALGSVRTHLRNISGSGDAGALIPGMVLGDTSLQTPQFRDAMRRSGLTHLVAVSGANFAIISLFVLWCMQWLVRSLRWRIIVTAIALSGFIALVRPSPSVLRAAAMASVVLFAKAVGRRSDSLPALGFAIAAVVIGDPWQARDPGFALSVLATAGLLLLAPRIVHWLARFIPLPLASALSPPIAAVLMCAPILMALSGYIGPMTVIANLLAAPVVAPITVLGFIAALIAPISSSIASFLLFFVRIPAGWIAAVAHWSAHFPVIQFSSGLGGFVGVLIFFIALLAAMILLRNRRSIFLVVAGVLICALLWSGRWPGGDWQVANCDVGQGDSLVINLGAHRAIVIDTGPDAQLEDRCLSQLGIQEISLLVLSHFHADHVEGVAGLIHHRKVRQVWVSNINDPVFESQRVRQWLAPLPLVVVARGMSAHLSSNRGPVSLSVLWPDDAAHAFDVLPGDGSAVNNSSIALLVNAPDFSLFSAGDLEPAVQSEILDSVAPVDIYKVSHHGSVYQSVPFMERLSPALAIISVGAGNTYGHPAPETLAVLARLPSKVYRTDINGAIAVTARSHRLRVRTSGGSGWWQRVRLG